MPLIDLTGQTFGRLTVLQRVEDYVQPNGHRKTQYLCECSCPNHTRIVVTSTHLRSGHTQSCGCLSAELSSKRLLEREVPIRFYHGKNADPIYNTYNDMVSRCYYPNNINSTERYYNRGIRICDDWYDPDTPRGEVNVDKFRNFYNWSKMLGGYEEGKTIDRVDNDGNYSPDNCRWANSKEQQNNKSCNRFIEYNGQTFTIGQWADILGYKYDVLYDKLRFNGFNMYAIMKPVDVGYGYTVPMLTNGVGIPYPMNGLYFMNQYGFPVSQNDYVPPQPIPGMWKMDEKGFVTEPLL